MSDTLTLIVPGDPDQRTGGYLYDRRITEELRRSGWDVRVVGLAGQFPRADALAATAMNEALSALPDGQTVVIDGLALGAVPDAVAPHAARLNLTALVHHPLADETGLGEAEQQQLLDSERRALALVRRIIVTSAFTARRLRELGLSKGEPIIVEPGVAAAALAPAAKACLNNAPEPTEQSLLCVASLTPRKGQDLLLTALGGLTHHGWRCRLSGSDQRDPAYARRLHEQCRALALDGCIELPGERDQASLEADYAWATVCVLPSHYEGYGMVVTEALARGLPLISTTGGALADTVPDAAGLKVAPNDAEGLRQALVCWLSEPALRRQLTVSAIEWRDRLPGWGESAERFAAALARP